MESKEAVISYNVDVPPAVPAEEPIRIPIKVTPSENFPSEYFGHTIDFVVLFSWAQPRILASWRTRIDSLEARTGNIEIPAPAVDAVLLPYFGQRGQLL